MVDIDTPYGAIGTRIAPEPTLLSEAYALLASANTATTKERRVLKSAVRTVVVREFNHYSEMEEDSRRLAALRGVREFLKAATETPSITASYSTLPAHADMFRSGHPLSRRTSTNEEKAQWLAADPNVPEPLRPVVASALANPYDSVEGIHARERLRSQPLPKAVVEQIND